MLEWVRVSGESMGCGVQSERDGKEAWGPCKQVYLTVCSPRILREKPHGCNDERNRELCVLGGTALNQGPQGENLAAFGPHGHH